MITKVYVAGASSEITRASLWARKLRDADIVVTSSWMDVIGRVGAANPKDATREQYVEWVLRDLAEVREASILWLQLPQPGVHTVGAYVELGYAANEGLDIVTSGHHRPIFTPALSHVHFDHDADAFALIVEQHRKQVHVAVALHLANSELTPG